jgi:hypothetical protein
VLKKSANIQNFCIKKEWSLSILFYYFLYSLPYTHISTDETKTSATTATLSQRTTVLNFVIRVQATQTAMSKRFTIRVIIKVLLETSIINLSLI